MIRLCPHCGSTIDPILMTGVATCDHCNMIFDTSDKNLALSVGWICRKWHIDSRYTLEEKFDFPKRIIDLVEEYVIDQDYSHDEFLKVLNSEY